MSSLHDSCVPESTRATGDLYSNTDSNNYTCRGFNPTTAGMGGEHSMTSTVLGGDDFIGAALPGMYAGSTAKASAMAPMPGVLGNRSSSYEGKDVGGDGISPPKDTEVGSVGCGWFLSFGYFLACDFFGTFVHLVFLCI